MSDVQLPYGYYGIIGFDTPPTEYIGANIPNLPSPRHTFSELKIQYNQNEVYAESCTEHGNIGSVSDNSGKTYTLDERKALWQVMIQNGATSQGYYVNKACDDVRHDWNTKNPTDTISSFSVNLISQDFIRALNAGYSVTVGYYGNQAYNLDFIKDGVLDQTSFGPSTYGHCVRLTKGNGDTFNMIVDNYSNSPGYPNTYEIPMGHLPVLVTNHIYSQNGYYFVFNNDLQSMNSMSPWAINAIAKAEAKGLKVLDPQKLLTTDDVQAYFVALGKLSNIQLPLTEERFLVALERGGMLD